MTWRSNPQTRYFLSVLFYCLLVHALDVVSTSFTRKGAGIKHDHNNRAGAVHFDVPKGEGQ
mgnify:CR=1 FL=1